MKCRVAYLAAVVLIAAGMIYAQSSQGSNSQGSLPSQSVSPAATAPCNSERPNVQRSNVQGALPGSKQGEVQSGKASQAGSQDEQPGAMALTTARTAPTAALHRLLCGAGRITPQTTLIRVGSRSCFQSGTTRELRERARINSSTPTGIQRARSICRAMASAACCGSSAAEIGRPTTR